MRGSAAWRNLCLAVNAMTAGLFFSTGGGLMLPACTVGLMNTKETRGSKSNINNRDQKKDNTENQALPNPPLNRSNFFFCVCGHFCFAFLSLPLPFGLNSGYKQIHKEFTFLTMFISAFKKNQADKCAL